MDEYEDIDGYEENPSGNFVYGNYSFVLFGASPGEITYKINPIFKNVKIDKFYNDIMHNEKLNISLGLLLGNIILSKDAYITVDQIRDTYYMILNIRLVSLDGYRSLFDEIPIRTIYDTFEPMIIGDYRFPVSIVINKISIDSNVFDNTFQISINISNVDYFNKIQEAIFPDVFEKIDWILSGYINQSHLLKIGFEHKYVAINAVDSIRLIGYLMPNSINDVELLSVTEDSIVIKESNKWLKDEDSNEDSSIKEDSFSIYDIIPYFYNTKKYLFSPSNVLSDRTTIMNDEKFHIIEFDTSLLILEDSNKEKTSNDIFNTIDYHFNPLYTTQEFSIYKSRKMFSKFKYCGFFYRNKSEAFNEFIRNKKKLNKLQMNFFYAGNNTVYFIAR